MLGLPQLGTPPCRGSCEPTAQWQFRSHNQLTFGHVVSRAPPLKNKAYTHIYIYNVSSKMWFLSGFPVKQTQQGADSFVARCQVQGCHLQGKTYTCECGKTGVQRSEANYMLRPPPKKKNNYPKGSNTSPSNPEGSCGRRRSPVVYLVRPPPMNYLLGIAVVMGA